MLVQLKVGGSSQISNDGSDALALLLECHERIRRHAALAQKLVESKDAPADQVQEAARQVIRYFTVALPLHVEDEDLSLAPRMRARGVKPEALAHVEQMVQQHVAIEELLGRLVPRWRALAEAAPQPEALAALAPDTAPLCTLLEDHLQLEEQHLFPVARAALTAEDLAALGAELKARRAPKP